MLVYCEIEALLSKSLHLFIYLVGVYIFLILLYTGEGQLYTPSKLGALILFIYTLLTFLVVLQSPPTATKSSYLLRELVKSEIVILYIRIYKPPWKYIFIDT